MMRFKGMTPEEKKAFLKEYFLRKKLTVQEIAALTPDRVTPDAIRYWTRKFFEHEDTNLVN